MHIPDIDTSLGETRWPGQFYLSKSACPIPKAWKSCELMGWSLAHSPDLPVCRIVDKQGHAAGWLVGLATRTGALLSGAVEIKSESELAEFGGGWVALHLQWRKVYLDSLGHLSVVYSSDGSVVTTNPEFIDRKTRNDPLCDLMRIPQKDNWYPFGLTPWQDVNRLLPNHYLDLGTGIAHRYWPNRETIDALASLIDLTEATRLISDLMKQNIDAIAARGHLQASLTAGIDSRTVLACARRHTAKLECISHYLHPKTGRLDLLAAKTLARRNGLALRVLRQRRSTPAQMQAWLMRTGHCAAGANYLQVGTFSQDGDLFPTLTGHGGEILKGSYASSGAESSIPTTSQLVHRLGLPANDEVLEAAMAWRDGLLDTGVSLRAVWDLLYVEQRTGCWAGVLRHGTPGALGFWPLSHRTTVAVAMRLPTELKQQEAVHRAIIAQEWPELLEVPVNAWWGWRRQVRKLTGPTRAAKRSLRALLPRN